MELLQETTLIGGTKCKVYKDLSLEIDGKTFQKEEVQEAVNLYKGCNRIHKPMVLLFWTDVKNGEGKDWRP